MLDSNRPPDVSTFHLRRRTPGSFLLVPCPQAGRSIRCQGQLEAATAVTLSSCPQVRHIQEQPLAIWHTWQEVEGRFNIQLLDVPPAKRSQRPGGPRFSYIVPDFLVEMAEGRKRLVEVKPSHRLTRPKVQRKLAVGQLFSTRSGWTFHVITEKELYRGDLLSNLRLLNRYRRAQLDHDLLGQLETLVPTGGIELGIFLSSTRYEDPCRLRIHVFHLLAKGRLSFDPRTRPLDDNTILFPGGVISWDPFDSVWAPSGCSRGGSGGSSVNLPPIVSLPKTYSST